MKSRERETPQDLKQGHRMKEREEHTVVPQTRDDDDDEFYRRTTHQQHSLKTRVVSFSLSFLVVDSRGEQVRESPVYACLEVIIIISRSPWFCLMNRRKMLVTSFSIWLFLPSIVVCVCSVSPLFLSQSSLVTLMTRVFFSSLYLCRFLFLFLSRSGNVVLCVSFAGNATFVGTRESVNEKEKKKRKQGSWRWSDSKKKPCARERSSLPTLASWVEARETISRGRENGIA